MTMSDVAISVSGLSKSFKRFAHPGWRALNALGVAVPSSKFDSFDALLDINIDIGRGEKVALIGRNGAGKSTLLRLISGQMRADQGAVVVNGQVQALMEMGTGFHPDFTGIENIRSALAFQGLSPLKVSDCIEDIADFSELDDFLNRPVKEYSAGMYARLAFAVATCITPEILIIDEVLGAGDAYFMGKSIQRMKVLTGQGATILFVSHDMGSVQMLCDRGIWLDRGRVREDGDLLSVSKAYMASVREDEERRVKARSMALTKKQAMPALDSTRASVLLRLIGAQGQAPKGKFLLASIRYGDETGSLGVLSPAVSDDVQGPLMDSEHMNWRLDHNVADRICWVFSDFGGRFLHAPFRLVWPVLRPQGPWVELEFQNESGEVVHLDQYDQNELSYRTCSLMEPTSGAGWQRLRLALSLDQGAAESNLLSDLPGLSALDRYGSGEIHLTGFGFFDGQGVPRHTLETGKPAFAVLSYEALQPVESAVPTIAVYRTDGTCAMQLIASLSGQVLRDFVGRGGVRVDLDPLYLGPGDYLVSVALFKQLNLASTIEPEAYDLHDRCYALKVLPPVGIQVEIGMVNQPAGWKMV